MSSIRLKHASGNSMSLAAPGTNPASNLELKLPHTIGSANQLLKVDGNGQLGWATDSTTDSTKLPLSGGTLTGHLTVNGEVITSDDININADNKKLNIGIGADLQLYHDSSSDYSYIEHTHATGHFVIRNTGADSNIYLQARLGEQSIVCHDDGAVELYNNGNLSATTASDDFDVYRRLRIHADRSSGMGGHQLAIGQWDGTNHRIEGDGNRPIFITTYNSGGIRFGYQAGEKLRITSAGDVGINTTSPVRKFHVNGTARVSGAFEAYPASTSAISAGTFYNNSTGASADCRVQIKTYANQGADPYLHFDAGGSNFICGMKYEGTTNNKFMIGAGDSPSNGILGGLYIHGGGNLSINNSSNPSRRLAIYDTSQVQYYSYGNSAAHFNQQYQSSTNSGTQYYNVFTRLDGSWDGYLVSSTDGQITLANNSDYRLKDNVVSMTNGIDIVKKLNPITYNWKASTGRNTSVTMQGFFAHEVDEAGVLGAVDGVKDGVWETAENPEDAAIGDPRIQGLSLERLVPALTAALKEAITKIETLETKVAALEAG